MAPRAASAAVASPDSVAGEANQLEPESRSLRGQQGDRCDKDSVPPLPFQIRDVVPGDKAASARVFLAEAPIELLRDMCFYFQITESGGIDELVARLVDRFEKKFSDACTSEKNAIPTPLRSRAPSADLQAVSTATRPSAVKTRGKKVSVPKREEPPAEQDAPIRETKRQKREAEEPKAEEPKAANVKTTEKLQKQYCVPGLSVAAQMKIAMQLSMGK